MTTAEWLERNRLASAQYKEEKERQSRLLEKAKANVLAREEKKKKEEEKKEENKKSEMTVKTVKEKKEELLKKVGELLDTNTLITPTSVNEVMDKRQLGINLGIVKNQVTDIMTEVELSTMYDAVKSSNDMLFGLEGTNKLVQGLLEYSVKELSDKFFNSDDSSVKGNMIVNELKDKIRCVKLTDIMSADYLLTLVNYILVGKDNKFKVTNNLGGNQYKPQEWRRAVK